MDARSLKIEAARAALAHVEDGMRLGIGTGSTAEEFVRLLAEKVAAGLQDHRRADLGAHGAGFAASSASPLSTLDETPELDLTIDGADEIDPDLEPDQGRRRGAAAREDRRRGIQRE